MRDLGRLFGLFGGPDQGAGSLRLAPLRYVTQGRGFVALVRRRPRESCSAFVHHPGWWGVSQAVLQITSNPSAASGLGIGVLAMYFSSGTRPTRPCFCGDIITCIHSL